MSEDIELRQEHYELLRAIAELQDEAPDDGYRPSTKDVGERLLAIYKERGGPYFFLSSPPWHGTTPMADELRAAGLVDVRVGMAQFHHRNAPTPSARMYWLGLTDDGRQVLAEQAS